MRVAVLFAIPQRIKDIVVCRGRRDSPVRRDVAKRQRGNGEAVTSTSRLGFAITISNVYDEAHHKFINR